MIHYIYKTGFIEQEDGWFMIPSSLLLSFLTNCCPGWMIQGNQFITAVISYKLLSAESIKTANISRQQLINSAATLRRLLTFFL